MTLSLTKTRFAALAVVSALALAGCSASAEPEESTSPTATGAAALVPAEVAADGKWTIGVDTTYPPNEYYEEDGVTLTGMDIELGNAIAERLGLTAEWVSAPFDAIIPSLQSVKYESGISSFTINNERMAVVDFVSYYQAGTTWAAAAGSTITPDTACGKNIAVQKGTTQAQDIADRSAACEAAGKAAITINIYQSQQEAAASVINGKNEAMLADSDVVTYAVLQSNGALEVVGDLYDMFPYGIAVPKGLPGMADAIKAALEEIIADGTYAAILAKWSADGGAITAPEINPAVEG